MSLYIELVAALTRAITGSLYTDDQIKSITKGATGKYLKEFFPTTKNELDSQNRVDSARTHIEAASTIIRDMQEDLETQDKQLSTLLETITEKKKLADRYQTLADTNKEAFNAFRLEMEEALRKELVEQTYAGKRIRQSRSSQAQLLVRILKRSLLGLVSPNKLINDRLRLDSNSFAFTTH